MDPATAALLVVIFIVALVHLLFSIAFAWRVIQKLAAIHEDVLASRYEILDASKRD